MILGINTYTHDVAVAVLGDGGIPILLLEEERLSRKRHHSGFIYFSLPPFRCVQHALQEHEVSHIAHSRSIDYSAQVSNVPQSMFQEWARTIDPNLRKSSFHEHHKCHAAHAFYSSDFEKAYVLVIDARGEASSIGIYVGDSLGLREIFHQPYRPSICSFYSFVTELLGYGKRQEGTTMALASFGSVDEIISARLFTWTGFGIALDGESEFCSRAHSANVFQQKADVAATLQHSFENVILQMLHDVCSDHSIQNLCIAGGGALNCQLNGVIARSGRWSRIHVPFAPGDSGTAIGAAFLAGAGRSNGAFHSPYLGRCASAMDVEVSLKAWKVPFRPCAVTEIVDLIVNGAVVGVCAGREEFGPRALGNRSILADPTNLASKKRLNAIKHRQEWRPVAPTLLEEDAFKFLKNTQPSPFMNLAFRLSDLAMIELPAITHADNTARAQIVSEKSARSTVIGQVLLGLRSVGRPAVVCNTSFNSQEPIVSDVKDAIRTFYSSPLDALFCEGYLITK